MSQAQAALAVGDIVRFKKSVRHGEYDNAEANRGDEGRIVRVPQEDYYWVEVLRFKCSPEDQAASLFLSPEEANETLESIPSRTLGCQHLVVMQGAPGSGKTTMAAYLAAGLDALIYSTDEFFGASGTYQFEASKLAENHQKNQARTKLALERGESVIVDNTNAKRWEARPYVEMGTALAVPVVFVRCCGTWNNIHGVPEERVSQMRASLEDLSVEGCLRAKYPWEACDAGA